MRKTEDSVFLVLANAGHARNTRWHGPLPGGLRVAGVKGLDGHFWPW